MDNRDALYLANKVYQVDPDESGVKKGKYPQVTENTKVLVDSNSGRGYQVLDVTANSKQKDGFQAMAVAPIVDGHVDKSRVTIAYAGTNSSDVDDLKTDAQSVVFEQNSTQWEEAQKFADRIIAKYPNAEITTTGHSLGGFLASAIAAEHRLPSIVFSAPTANVNIVSKKAREWAAGEGRNKIINYRHAGDALSEQIGADDFGTVYTAKVKKRTVKKVNGKEAIGVIIPVAGAAFAVMDRVSQSLYIHNMGSYELTSSGEVILSNGRTPSGKVADKVLAMQQPISKVTKQYAQKKLTALDVLRKRFKASGGGLSSSEKIMLDEAAAYVVASTIETAVDAAADQIEQTLKQGKEDLADIWNNGIKLARKLAPDLSDAEIYDALEDAGVTKRSIVKLPSAGYDSDLKDLQDMKDSYKTLVTDVKTTIDQIKDADEQMKAVLD